LLRNKKILISRDKVKVALLEFPREVITAEEIIRRRVLTIVRIGLATMFFWLSALISVGATAIAKTVTKDQPTKTKSAARHRHHYKSSKHTSDPNLSMVGTASWYGHGFHNRKTASGKKFDQNSFVAAHRTLPFGTKVLVRNLDNDKTCIVEITDRGPYVKDRIIDVSHGAAKALGFAGLAHVSLEIVQPVNFSYSPIQSPKVYPAADALRAPVMALK
jgi:rare lipoprotein A